MTDLPPDLVERVARAICYWDKAGTCHDNYCGGECRAARPDEAFFKQARAALEAAGYSRLIEGLLAIREKAVIAERESPYGFRAEWASVGIACDALLAKHRATQPRTP